MPAEPMIALLQGNRQLRRFLAAFLQSQLGTWAAYVALLVVAYQRLHSSWAISLVLLCEFVPGIVLAPMFGALADRCSRRRLAVCADLMRAGCFVALALISSFTATIVLVLLAGVGTALFRPTINAALPGMVEAEHRSQLTAAFYGCVNIGVAVGPALTAVTLLVTSAPVVLLGNAASFVVSAALLAGVDLGPRREVDSEGGERLVEQSSGSVWSETKAGAGEVARLPGVSTVLAMAALVVLAGAMVNVAVPLLASGPLSSGGSGYSLLMAVYGLGMLGGSWAVARAGREIGGLRRRWLFGIALSGVATIAVALAPDLGVALVAFTLVGLGDNLLIGPEMRLVQELVPARLHGRAFGIKDVMENIAFVAAFVGAGGLLSLAGPRAVFAGTGLLMLVLSATGGLALRERPVIGSTLVLSE